jgi:hypothetical protein
LSELDAPAAAEPELLVSVELVLELLLPEAAPCVLVDDEELGLLVELDGVLFVVDELVLPLADGVLELLLVEGDVELVDGEVPPAALELVPELGVLEPDALPEPVDWLVCAPWVIVDDGLVWVVFWLAEAEPVDTLESPVPRFTPAPTFAPAFTGELEIPTFASTPTLGFTSTLPEGALVLPLLLLGCELEDWLVVDDWSVVDWAKAGPNAPITAAAVILTAKLRSLMLPPWLRDAEQQSQWLCRAVPVVFFPTFR